MQYQKDIQDKCRYEDKLTRVSRRTRKKETEGRGTFSELSEVGYQFPCKAIFFSTLSQNSISSSLTPIFFIYTLVRVDKLAVIIIIIIIIANTLSFASLAPFLIITQPYFVHLYLYLSATTTLNFFYYCVPPFLQPPTLIKNFLSFFLISYNHSSLSIILLSHHFLTLLSGSYRSLLHQRPHSIQSTQPCPTFLCISDFPTFPFYFPATHFHPTPPFALLISCIHQILSHSSTFSISPLHSHSACASRPIACVSVARNYTELLSIHHADCRGESQSVRALPSLTYVCVYELSD